VFGRGFELRLESMSKQEHEIGRLDPLHVAGRSFEVVRLDPRRREVRDVDVAPADLFRCECERIEGCNDAFLSARRRGVIAAAAADQEKT